MAEFRARSMRNIFRYLAAFGSASVLALLAACGGGSPSPGNPSSGDVTGQPPTLALLAGAAPGGPGNVDGPGVFARFNRLLGITVDGTGSVYVSDSGSYTIRKIGADGTVSTWAGAFNQAGFSDGQGSAARFGGFAFPQEIAGLAADSAGNIYVADAGNHSIRKISPAGSVITLAGDGQPGNIDGVGRAARFNRPFGVAVDRAGNVYVADLGNITVRKISPGGSVSTIAGTAGQTGSVDGPAAQALFGGIGAIAVDSTGNVYVTDSGNSTVRKITQDGVVSTVAGASGVRGSADGAGAGASFFALSGITIDPSDNVYVTDNDTVRKIAPGGVVTTIAGSPGMSGAGDGEGSVARFNGPFHLAAGASTIFVADTQNNSVRTVTPTGKVATLAGASYLQGAGYADGVGSEARFSGISGVTVDRAANAYVVEGAPSSNHTIRKITPAGVVTTLASYGANILLNLNGVAIDDAGTLYVGYTNFCGLTDHFCVRRGQIHRIDAAGARSTVDVITSSDGSGTELGFVNDVARDRAGNLYIVEESSGIRRLSPGGDLTMLAPTSAIGNAVALTVDDAGNVYVVAGSLSGSTIRKVDSAGMATTIVAPGTSSGNAARLGSPRGVAVDSQGNLYVSDSTHVVHKITPSGSASIIAGTEFVQGFIPGSLPGVLNVPRGVAVHANDLYITMDTAVAIVRNRP